MPAIEYEAKYLDIDPTELADRIRAADGTPCGERLMRIGGFETAPALLGRAGITPRSYQENGRESWLLDGVRLEIDEWPRISRIWRSKATTLTRSGSPHGACPSPAQT
jgi:adenylate cyclase class 2